MLIFVLFLLLQVLDGVFTSIGVSRWGLDVEGNILIVGLAHLIGIYPAIILAKLIAVACGLVLYVTGELRTLKFLSTVYLVAAIVPWVIVLTVW